MLTVKYIGEVSETLKEYIDLKETGCAKVVRGEHIYPEDFGKTREEFEKLAKPKTTISFRFIISDPSHQTFFSTETKLFGKEKWRKLVAAIEKPEGEYRLIVEEDYPLHSAIEAKETNQVQFSSGAMMALIPKEICLEAFRQAQADLDKYHDPEVWYQTQRIHSGDGPNWYMVDPY